MWKPMTEHIFPWNHKQIFVLAFDNEYKDYIEIFKCQVGEHGAIFPNDGGMLTLLERGWIPYAWAINEWTPEPNNIKFPPLYKDYLIDRSLK